jgi:hypothetical protein
MAFKNGSQQTFLSLILGFMPGMPFTLKHLQLEYRSIPAQLA